MPKKITVVDINQGPLPETEEVKEEVVEQPVDQVETPVEQPVNQVETQVEQPIEQEVEPPVETKLSKKERPKTMVTCPDCGRSMLEKNLQMQTYKCL